MVSNNQHMKHMKVNGRIIPYIMKNKKCLKPPTSIDCTSVIDWHQSCCQSSSLQLPFVAVKNPSTQGLNIKRLVFPLRFVEAASVRLRTWSSNPILWRRSRLRFKGGPPGGWWAQRGHWAQKQVTKSVPQSEWLADSEAEQKHLISIWQISIMITW
jgi:hypothetical protein